MSVFYCRCTFRMAFPTKYSEPHACKRILALLALGMLLCSRHSIVFWLAALIPVGEQRISIVADAFILRCEDVPTSSRHIENGSGTCLVWGPKDSDYGCCLLCNEADSMSSQYIPPGGKDPFNGDVYNDASCCCYYAGVFVEGDDGTTYYSK